jgi:hypothetical protein
MLRSSIYAASALALSAAAFAQKQELRSFERVTGPVRHAGVFHVATGQWTRGAAAQLTAGAGSDIVYNCTTDSGYYAGLSTGQTWTASGRLASTTSPGIVWNPIAAPVGTVPGSAPGCANSYTIDGFEIAYCSEILGTNTAMTVAFYESWNPICTSAPIAPPQGGPFAITGLPGGFPASPALGCWIVQIDLAGATASFNMLADGDGSYLDNTSDAFGWSFTFPSITSTLTQAGPLLNGCPSDGTGPGHNGIGWRQFPPSTTVEAAGYDGTRFDGPSGAAAPTYPLNGAVGMPTPGGEDGSDMVGDDGMRIDGAIATPGCYFFGGPLGSGGANDGPYSNFHMELYAKTVCAPPPPGVEYCAGDGIDPNVTTACPCANFGATGNGCASSFNAAGAHITAHGAVATDDVVLDGSGMNNTGNSIFLKGDTDDLGGVVFGDGVRCAVGTLIRLRTVPLVAGTSSFPDSTQTITLSARGGTPVGSGLTGYYTVYYRNAAAAFCPPGTFNTANGYKVTW